MLTPRIPRGNLTPAAVPNRVTTATTASPFMGLNTRDAFAQMDARYALVCQNFICTPQGLQPRQGYVNFATNVDTSYTQSMMVYKGSTTSADKMFACAGSSIYDVTAGGTSFTAVQTGLSNALWEHTNMSLSALGNVHALVCCNGVDNARFWNGSAWTQFTFATTPSAPGQITTSAVMTNVNDWKQVIVHQMRMWVSHPNSTILHYFPINSMGGQPAAFPVSFKRGGSVAAMQSMSVDLGAGLTEYLVIYSTSGDVVIYAGDDPSDATNFSLYGQWALAEPVGVRGMYPYTADLVVLNRDGLLQLSTALKSFTVITNNALSDAIQPTMASIVSQFSTLPGFQMISYPGENMLIVNIPQVNADQNFQFVYDTVTQGWSQITGWGAQCWAYFNGNMYFGGKGKVCKAFTGYKDNANADGSGGSSYVAYAQQAFNYFEQGSQTKLMTFARPNLQTAVATPQVFVGCNMDFNMNQPFTTASVPPSQGNVWDAAIWDLSTWGYGGQNYNVWQGISGEGYCASLTLAISVNDYTLWASTDWQYQLGGIYG